MSSAASELRFRKVQFVSLLPLSYSTNAYVPNVNRCTHDAPGGLLIILEQSSQSVCYALMLHLLRSALP